MNVLVVGGGGREHALAWKLSLSKHVTRVFVAPGNGGTAGEPKTHNITVRDDDLDGLLHFALQNKIELTVIGPEVPLVKGIVDLFQANGLKILGPTKNAAQLEGSKNYAKQFMCRYGIPTGRYETFTDFEQASEYVKHKTTPVVIKADGLAAGKGVVIAHTHDEAQSAIKVMLREKKFGTAGQRVVIEEFLQGEEASFICLVGGKHYLPLASSQDHKARDDGDHGPNTGGMGAYSPAPIVTPEIHQKIIQRIIEPTISGLASEDAPYSGFLYAGLMIDEHGNPRVLEYNCRFGDPETQPILMRMKSDFFELCVAAVEGTLHNRAIEWDTRTALGVVLCAGGYPETYAKGHEIYGLDLNGNTDLKVFHAGTLVKDEKIITNGGRVLCVTALGPDAANAQQRAYEAVKQISWSDMYYRRDIGYRAVQRAVKQ